MADDSFQKDLQKGLPTACSISRILPMLEPWYDPGYVKRAWCRFELYTAIWMYREVEVDIILSPKAANAFPDAVVAAIGGMRVHGCGRCAQAHLHRRRLGVGPGRPCGDPQADPRLPRGFETLNETIKQRL